MPLRYRCVTYRYTAPGTDVARLFRRIWELSYVQAGASLWPRPAAWPTRARWRPPTDVLEGPEGLLVKIELAGLREEDIDITLFPDALVVTGRREEEYPGGIDWHSPAYRYHESGVRYGEFEVEVYLPFAVDPDRVEARYERGFLYIALPRVNGSGDALRM